VSSLSLPDYPPIHSIHPSACLLAGLLARLACTLARLFFSSTLLPSASFSFRSCTSPPRSILSALDTAGGRAHPPSACQKARVWLHGMPFLALGHTSPPSSPLPAPLPCTRPPPRFPCSGKHHGTANTRVSDQPCVGFVRLASFSFPFAPASHHQKKKKKSALGPVVPASRHSKSFFMLFEDHQPHHLPSVRHHLLILPPFLLFHLFSHSERNVEKKKKGKKKKSRVPISTQAPRSTCNALTSFFPRYNASHKPSPARMHAWQRKHTKRSVALLLL